MSVSHIYDPAGRETVLGNYGQGGVALAVFSSTYDAMANRLTILEVDGTHVTFSYDPSYQLLNEQRSGVNAYNTTYSYDPAGNRLTKLDSGVLITSTYNAANELVLVTPSSGPTTICSYDGNGNLALENAAGVLTTYAWDFENRLTVYAAPTGTETYTYSTDGLRQQKVNSQGTTNYVWDGQNVLLETNASLITQAHNTDNPGYWGGLASENRSGTSSFYGFDSQTSARILVSISGLVTDNYSYKAFGEELASGSGTTNPYRYIGAYGYYRDIATRQYVRARHRAVTNGRWISRDPIGFDDRDWNLYRYVANNPAVYLDPSGSAPPTQKAPKYPKDDGGCDYDPDGARKKKKIHDKMKQICTKLRQKGVGWIRRVGALNGTMAQCVLDYCNDGSYTCAGHCGSQNGNEGCAFVIGGAPGASCLVQVCDAALTPGSLCYEEGLCVGLVHEIVGCCGVPHGPNGTSAPGDLDPCNPKAKRLCSQMGL
jgi:RHS repeat-associated protein